MPRTTTATPAAPAGAGERAKRQPGEGRVSAGEWAGVQARAAERGLRPAAFVREVALRRRVSSVPPVANLAAWAETARLAANLNQLAAHANGGRLVGADELAPVLDALRMEVGEMRRALLGVGAEDEDEG